MSEAGVWSIDRIAANNLALDLGMVLDAAQLDRAAKHFADHRASACEWAAERTQSRIIEKLETATMEYGRYHDAHWMDGFLKAEQVVMTLSPGELGEVNPGPPVSRGRVLRQMVRQARSENGLAG